MSDAIRIPNAKHLHLDDYSRAWANYCIYDDPLPCFKCEAMLTVGENTCIGDRKTLPGYQALCQECCECAECAAERNL